MIKRMTASAMAVAMAFVCALAAFSTPAMAAVTNPACSNLPVVNGSTTYQECSYGNGTNIWLEHMAWGWDYTGLQPHPFAVDPVTGDQIVNVFSLPAITFAAPQHVIVDSQTAASGGPTLANQQATLTADQAIQASTAAGATAALQSSVGATAHADAGSQATATAATTSAVSSAATQAHTDAGSLATASGQAAQTASLGTIATNTGAGATSALQASVGATAHADAGTQATATAATTSAVSAAATQAHTDASTLPTNAATQTTLNTVALNTARNGTGTYQLMTTPATNGSAQPAGVTGTQVVLQTTSDSVTYTVEAAATCGASAPATTITATGPTVVAENLSGVIFCATAMAGAPRVRGY